MWVLLFLVDLVVPPLAYVAYSAMVASWLVAGLGWALVWWRSRYG